MDLKEMMKQGITSSILTPVDETFLDKDGNIVSVERFVPVTPSSACPRPDLELTPREIAETMIPDMTTVPMSDDEIKRFMES